MVSSDISVHRDYVTGLPIVADLLASVVDAHSARGLVRAVAESLARHLPITRVELATPAIAAELGDDWRVVDAPATIRLHELAPGVRVALRGGLPAFCKDAAFRAALRGVLHNAYRHLEVVQRVGSVARRAHADNRSLRADLDRLDVRSELVARSPGMRAVQSRIALVARHPTTVLVTGESGVGKEVVARELHRLSARGHRPMVHVNCGAIPPALVESELFGHDRGAFTGAERSHTGVFERASRSTLLLDEIGELPLAAQAKLLRVLQERRIRRVGGEADIEVDVRLVAATNRSLADMVAAGTFREDLYYRLDVFAIEIPPLRDRREDLLPLATALTHQIATRLGVAAPAITKADLARLAKHDWPGNVRELANVLESAVILGAGALVLPDDLTRRARSSTSRPLDTSIRDAIEAALRDTRGKLYGKDGAAARLGLEPSTLQSKMKKLGIDRLRFTRVRR